MTGLIAVFSRHGRFYISLALGAAAAAGAWGLGVDTPLLAGGDVFYLVFLTLCLILVAGQKTEELKRRARTEDEGIGVVLFIVLATMGFFCAAVFEALNAKHGIDVPALVLAMFEIGRAHV